MKLGITSCLLAILMACVSAQAEFVGASPVLPDLRSQELLSTQDADPPKKESPEAGDTSEADAAPEPPRTSAETRELIKKGKRGLRRALARGDHEKIAQWVESLGTLGEPDAIEAILKVGERYTDDPVRTAVENALSWTKTEHGVEFLNKELLKVRVSSRAILIIEALQRIDHPLAADPLMEVLLKSKDTTLRVSCLHALRNKPSKAVVESLIQLFKEVQQTQDTVWAETRIVLLAMTGEAFTVYEDWANWWLTHGDLWQPPPPGRPVVKHRTGIYRPGNVDLELPQLFGQEVSSKRVVFVIDTSGSMAKVDKSGLEEGSQGGGPTRMQRAKRELSKVIRELRPDVKFNVIAFSREARPWQEKKLVLASPKNKRKALEFIDSWEPSSSTSTLEAMLMALDTPEVDTIILVSDGSPTIPGEGTIAEIPPILDEIRKTNRFRKIAVHTLGFPGAKVSFMRAIAKQNGGVYAHVK